MNLFPEKEEKRDLVKETPRFGLENGFEEKQPISEYFFNKMKRKESITVKPPTPQWAKLSNENKCFHKRSISTLEIVAKKESSFQQLQTHGKPIPPINSHNKINEPQKTNNPKFIGFFSKLMKKQA
jgi:hypothetical protein